MEQQLLDDQQQTTLGFYYKNLRTLCSISIVFIAAGIVAALVRAFLVFKLKGYFNGIAFDLTQEEAVWYDYTIGMLAIVVLLCMALSLIPLFMWVYRVYYNLDAVKLKGLNVAPGWAVGWFFIPFANLYYSPVVLNDMYKGTKYLAEGGTAKGNIEFMSYIKWGGLWFAFRIGAGILSYMGLYRVIAFHRLDIFQSAANYEIIYTVLNVVSGIIMIYLLVWITKKQHAIAEGIN